MTLSEEQFERYARHIPLPDVGVGGQERLLAATVAVEVGRGRDAEIAALVYLAAAGVGCLVLGGEARGALTEGEVDCGILYGKKDVGRPRVEAIRDRVTAINPDVSVVLAGERDADASADLRTIAIAPEDRDDVPTALIRGGEATVRVLADLIGRRS